MQPSTPRSVADDTTSVAEATTLKWTYASSFAGVVAFSVDIAFETSALFAVARHWLIVPSIVRLYSLGA